MAVPALSASTTTSLGAFATVNARLVESANGNVALSVSRNPSTSINLRSPDSAHANQRPSALTVSADREIEGVAIPGAEGKAGMHQGAGPIHVHPNGRFVYLTNRASSTVDFQGQKVLAGGENSVAVFAIDQTTGEPTLIQTIDGRGIQLRTFGIDPSGRLLVAASIMPLPVRDGSNITTLTAGLMVFRIGDDGRLTFARKYDVDTGDRQQFWSCMVTLA